MAKEVDFVCTRRIGTFAPDAIFLPNANFVDLRRWMMSREFRAYKFGRFDNLEDLKDSRSSREELKRQEIAKKQVLKKRDFNQRKSKMEQDQQLRHTNEIDLLTGQCTTFRDLQKLQREDISFEHFMHFKDPKDSEKEEIIPVNVRLPHLDADCFFTKPLTPESLCFSTLS